MEVKSVQVRIAYIQCMLACFNPNTVASAAVLIPLLLKAVDRAVAQPAQIPLVTEGLSASCMILKFVSSQGEKVANLQNFWNVLFDMEKQVFLSEKFLSLATEDGIFDILLRRLIVYLEYF